MLATGKFSQREWCYYLFFLYFLLSLELFVLYPVFAAALVLAWTSTCRNGEKHCNDFLYPASGFAEVSRVMQLNYSKLLQTRNRGGYSAQHSG